MRAMILTQVLPYPPDSGPKVKTWNVIKYLSKKHDLTLVSFTRGDQSKEIECLKKVCARVEAVSIRRTILHESMALVRSYLNGQPWMMTRDDRATMRHLVDRLANENHFDVAHADQMNMAQYAQRVKTARKLMDAHNALWQLYRRLAGTLGRGPRRWMLERDWKLMKRYEGNICRQFDMVTVVSEEDRLALSEAMGGILNASIIPITVDVDEFLVIERQPNANHILSIGTMYWPPNIEGMLWFLKEVFPLIQEKIPDVQFDIVGARPPAEIQAYDGMNEGVHVHGYVSDPLPIITQAGVMVVPLHAASGMRVKILNAMSQALPIVTTTIGCEGIDVEHDRHLRIADTPEQFSNDVIDLLKNPDKARQLGWAGRELIEKEYDYRIACRPLDDLYSGITPPKIDRV